MCGPFYKVRVCTTISPWKHPNFGFAETKYEVRGTIITKLKGGKTSKLYTVPYRAMIHLVMLQASSKKNKSYWMKWCFSNKTDSSLTHRTENKMHSYFSFTDSVYSMTSYIWTRFSAWLLLTCSNWWRSSRVTCSYYSSCCSCISCCTCLFFYYSIMPCSIFTSCYF